jgi:hypothetical protein
MRPLHNALSITAIITIFCSLVPSTHDNQRKVSDVDNAGNLCNTFTPTDVSPGMSNTVMS